MMTLLPRGSCVLGGRAVPYTIRRNPRARGMRLSISPATGLVVTLPVHYRRGGAVAKFLGRHGRWILRQVRRCEAVAVAVPRRWPYGATLPYLGEEHPVVLEAARGRAQVARLPDGTIRVSSARPTVAGAQRALKRWYLGEALAQCAERVMARAGQAGISYRRIAVGDQRRRWGSCSSHGTLSFNYRLVMAPPAVLDYVVVHELMHRKEPNHSPRFWALVWQHCPAYRDAVRWLRVCGPYLGV